MRGNIYVLVHGAWHGGWCWRRVAAPLAARGHRVTAPTQTGLGERSHLMSPDIDLGTFIDDIVNHIEFEDLNDVILVGHSFAGAVITGVADRVRERLSELVYLDASVIANGECAVDQLPQEIVDERNAAAERSSGGVSLPPPAPHVFGVRDPADIAWLDGRLTPHPWRTYTTPLRIDGPLGSGVRSRYIVCTAPRYRTIEKPLEAARQAGFRVEELATGHDAMVTDPAGVVALLDR